MKAARKKMQSKEDTEGPRKMISVYLTAEEKEQMLAAANIRGFTLSSFLRVAALEVAARTVVK
jgi:uncharacterized protein (DUF1778 family)